MSNAPSFRFPFTLPDDTHPAVAQALRYTFNGFTNHEQAFAALQETITAIQKQITSVSAATSTPTVTPTSSSWPYLGIVNNQSGQTAYTTQGTDNGTIVILDDASPIAVTLNTAVSTPYFLVIDNQGAGLATVTPLSGTISYPANPGAASLPMAEGTLAFIYFDGTNWWAATANTLATSVSVNGNIVTDPNFNDSTPGAGTNYQNVKWQFSGSYVSAEVLISPIVFVWNEVVSFSGTSGSLLGPLVAGTQMLYRNGVRLTPGGGNDYTISGTAITLALAAGAGDSFVADYVTSGSPSGFVVNEIVTFSGITGTLGSTPTSGTQTLYRNGIRLTPGLGNDYTISGATITLATAAGVGDTFLADYEHISFIFNEIVSFSGTSGSLGHTPIASTQALYRNGQRQCPGAGKDYTISGAAITLAVAAGVGDSFLADYES